MTHVTRTLCVSSALALCLSYSQLSFAGATVKIGEDKSISVGAGLRTSFTQQENAAPNSTDRSKEHELESIRLYLSGQIHKNIKFTFNTERDANSDVTVIDGIAQFEFSDAFNLWAGRLLPPSDRSNFSGPYYLTTWDFPLLVQRYPNIVAGRDDGLAIWGQPGTGRLKWQVGIFQGRDGGSNQKDNPLYAARLTYSFADVEKGYYNASTYFGAKDILTIGLVYMTQEDGAGTAATPGDFTGYNLDFLFEKKLSGGSVVTAEAAYYDYDLDGVADTALTEGDGYFVLAAYMFGNKVGIGQFQPHIRFQSFDPQGATGDTDRIDIGFNYVIDGHNARISVVYADEDAPGTANDYDRFIIGAQLQF